MQQQRAGREERERVGGSSMSLPTEARNPATIPAATFYRGTSQEDIGELG